MNYKKNEKIPFVKAIESILLGGSSGLNLWPSGSLNEEEYKVQNEEAR